MLNYLIVLQWDTTDGQSLSDRSTMLPDIYGRGLHRAIDSKIKKLRSLFTSDEDITTELDRIVCRLMKLAFRTSEDHQTPPPASWMQRKLLDLLSLTEKAIERRRKCFIENYPLKMGVDSFDHNSIQYKIRNNDTGNKIVDKYLLASSDENLAIKSEAHHTEDNLSGTSNEMEPLILEPSSAYGEVRLESIKSASKDEIHLEVAQAWVDGDFDVISVGNYVVKPSVKSSDSETSNDVQYNYKKTQMMSIQSPKKNIGSNVSHISKSKLTRRSKERNSKDKLIKKVSKKRSSCGQLNKNYSNKIEYIEYKSYTLNKPKRSFKGYGNLNSTSSKPIPRSLIEMCYQDLSIKKSDNIILPPREDHYIAYSPDNVAAAKESLFVDIVSENKEETIALRRTIATEITENSDIMESEALLETVINVTREDSFDGVNISPVEAVNSDIIFLYDLNEPSTSKGVRHVSADVQCGTDILPACPTPSAVSSLINVCEIDRRLGDSFTKIRLNKNSVDFGTITDENNCYRDFLSIFKKQTLKIKDSDVNLTRKVECSTMTQDLKLEPDIPFLQPVTSLHHAHDSSKNPTNVVNPSKSILNCLYNPSDAEIVSLSKYVRPKLSCSGIYVHSFRNRQISEDVVFQGEWQKNGAKVLVKKNPCIQVISRKFDNAIKKQTVNSKQSHGLLRHDKKVIKVAEKKSVHNHTNLKQGVITKSYNKKLTLDNSTPLKTRDHYKCVTKVASKIVTSLKTSRSLKNICRNKNNPVTISTHLNESKLNKKFKSYDSWNFNNIKKSPSINTIVKLNKTADVGTHQIKDKKLQPLNSLKPKELSKKLLHCKNQQHKNLTYLVFRNEIESSRSMHSSSAHSKELTSAVDFKNSYSPPSQNSSLCSSPNSIATVRALPRRKSCDKNNSSSPKNSRNISPDKFEIRKIDERYNRQKNAKLINSSSISNANKENFPETSKTYNINKTELKKSKVLVNNTNKNVYMLQVRTDSPPMIARKKSEVTTQHLNTNALLRSESIDNQRKLSNTILKKSSSNNKNNANTIKGQYKISEINNLTRSSTPILGTSRMINTDKQEYKNVINTESTRNNVKMSPSEINAAMQQLIEERLGFIKGIENNDSDSETVILSRDNNDGFINDISSRISYKTIITNEDPSNISGRDIENALLNYSFESNLESKATLGTIDSRLPSTDTDLISFKSSDSLSHLSGYCCLQNELDKTLTPKQTSETKAVRDLFERKDHHVINNTKAGVLAVQVFSGFSMDEEPIAGDQPEYNCLVDPETGYLALEAARQVTSEEIFVSGRSSDTYESCNVEDDAVIPNWLFHVISHQQSEEIPEEDSEAPEAEDHDEVEYDVNGNVMEAPGVGAGAGDGRGMHSDLSQDSSGRGTSISSSDVSSGARSEAILIDPAALFGSNANAIPMIAISVAEPVESSDTSFITVETDNETSYPHENRQRRSRRAVVASDVDADVSSIEPDGVDSDN